MDDAQRRDLADLIGSKLADNPGELSEVDLLKVYECFGGASMFEDAEDPYVRSLGISLLEAARFPSDEHSRILATGKLTRSKVSALSHHRSAYQDPAVFQKLWSKSKDSSWLAIYSALTQKASNVVQRYSATVEKLPMVHSDSCDGENHYWCSEPRIFHADVNLELELAERDFIFAQIHPDVLEIIHGEILSLSIFSREIYGSSPFVANSHWEELLVDKRPVLNSIARNALLPEKIARRIVATHKTANLRESIAASSTSKDLLDEIWNGTKSESIRMAVVGNAVSRKYLTHPDLLLPSYLRSTS